MPVAIGPPSGGNGGIRSREGVPPAIRRSGNPAIRRSGDPAIRRSGDPAIRRSGDPAIRRSGDPAIRRSGDPAIRRSGDPAIRRSGDPAIRRSGDYTKGNPLSTCQPLSETIFCRPGSGRKRCTQRADRMLSFVEDGHLDLSEPVARLHRCAQRANLPSVACSVWRTVCQTGRENNCALTFARHDTRQSRQRRQRCFARDCTPRCGPDRADVPIRRPQDMRRPVQC